jgi:uncharacterized protein
LSKALHLTGRGFGGTVVLPKMPIPEVGWLAHVKDPDGHMFGFLQPDQQAA